ncbi:hypothetical protein AAHE18_12G136900 [Arachis hypogaea]
MSLLESVSLHYSLLPLKPRRNTDAPLSNSSLSSSHCCRLSVKLLPSSVLRAIAPMSPKSNPYSLLLRAQPIRRHRLLVVWSASSFTVNSLSASSSKDPISLRKTFTLAYMKLG